MAPNARPGGREEGNHSISSLGPRAAALACLFCVCNSKLQFKSPRDVGRHELYVHAYCACAAEDLIAKSVTESTPE